MYDVCIERSSEAKVACVRILIGDRFYLCLPCKKETVNNHCDLKRLCHTVPRSVAEKGHCIIDDDAAVAVAAAAEATVTREQRRNKTPI